MTLEAPVTPGRLPLSEARQGARWRRSRSRRPRRGLRRGPGSGSHLALWPPGAHLLTLWAPARDHSGPVGPGAHDA